jgi:hypothetical protein
MLRKLCLIGVVVTLILPVQVDAGSDVPRTNAGGKTSTTTAQMPVGNMSIGGSAVSFTLTPVASTFILITQHGGQAGSHRLSYSGGKQHCQAAGIAEAVLKGLNCPRV